MHSPEKPETSATIEAVHRRMSAGYFFWFGTYATLGLAGVLLPGLIAMDAVPPGMVKIVAGAASMVAALLSFLRPQDYATGFDLGKQAAWKTRIAHDLGQSDAATVTSGLHRAVEATTFRYGTPVRSENDSGM